MMFPALVGGSLQETPRFGGWNNVTMTLDVFLYNNPGLTHVLEMLGSLLQSNPIIRIHWRIWTIEFKASHAFDLKKGRQKSQIIGAK